METSEYNSHSDEWDPSLDELIEAVENEDHPHHDQAVMRNRELAARMKPLSSIVASMWGPSEAVRVMSDESVGKMMAANIDLSTLFGTSGPIKRAIGQGDDLIPHFSADFSSSLNAEELPCVQGIGEKWRAEKEQRIEREKASVELLQTMVSQIVETNRRISELNVQLSAVGAALENSDANAAEGHKHAIRLGRATLIATGIGIAVPFVIFIMERFL